MKKIILIPFILLSISFNQNLKENTIQTVYNYSSIGGHLKEVINYKDGKRYGSYTRYHQNGQLQFSVTYNENGRRNGIFKSFYDSGRIRYEGFFVDGKYNGTVILYKEGLVENSHVEHLKFYVWNYKDGVKDGKTTSYHYFGKKKGKVLSEYIYKDGMEIRGRDEILLVERDKLLWID